jgi:hypothetical protein
MHGINLGSREALEFNVAFRPIKMSWDRERRRTSLLGGEMGVGDTMWVVGMSAVAEG